MILGMSTFTFLHVVISLIGIVAGIIVVAGLLTGQAFGRWTALFLLATLATSITGFAFPLTQLLPSHIVGAISLVPLTLAIVARYIFHGAGAWRWIYVLSAVLALYLNVFVLIAQLFAKVPALHAMAPTQSEPPFLVAQVIVLLAFIAIAVSATIKFRMRPVLAA
jgi:hypothetical protein